MTDITAGRLQRVSKVIVHPLTVRITHWLNALAMFIMIMSGWRIYNSDPIFPFYFPVELTLGGSYYVGFECADGYYSSIDMASALHPQTFLTFKISDEVLAPRYGYPLKLRIPTKLGFKNPKWITAMFVTNRFPGGFWEDRGYNWFGGV